MITPHMLTIVCSTKVCNRYTKVSSMKKDVLVDFGKKVRSRRIDLGLSQEELADKANVHRTYIGMIERAEKNITLENIEKISKALELNVRDLFDGEKE